MKKISIVSSCYNEELNVDELCARVKAQMKKYDGKYNYEHILLDNGSSDKTAERLRALAKKDKHIKVIINARNFGHIRSPIYGFLQSSGDAFISIVSDLQEPPELIPEFIKQWEEGHEIVIGVRKSSSETPLLAMIRKAFYFFIRKIADHDVRMVKNYTGFGLYDKKVLDYLRACEDPYPYFRGLVAEVGFDKGMVYYDQAPRKRGITANNFYTLYDMAMLGIVKYSKVPLRFFTFAGFVLSGISILISMTYLILKLLYWESFTMGTAPILIGIFFFSSVQLFALGIFGEYLGAIYTRVDKKPLVVEKERINF